MILSFILAGRPLRGKSGWKRHPSGANIPSPVWAKQRDKWAKEAFLQALTQHRQLIKEGWNPDPMPIRIPVKLSGIVRYPDKREADLDGVIGAIGHVLERAGILANDKLIQAVDVATGTQCKEGGVEIRLETNFARCI